MLIKRQNLPVNCSSAGRSTTLNALAYGGGGSMTSQGGSDDVIREQGAPDSSAAAAAAAVSMSTCRQ